MKREAERSGEFDELFSQLVLSATWKMLTEGEEGVNWLVLVNLLENEGLFTADLAALDWAAEVHKNPAIWKGNPLWEVQGEPLKRGLFLSSGALCARLFCQYLEKLRYPREVNFAVVDSDFERINSFSAGWKSWCKFPERLDLGTSLFQIIGSPRSVLRHLNYLWLNGPGLAYFRFSGSIDRKWLSVIEALLYRNFTVVLFVDRPFGDYDILSLFRGHEKISELSFPGLIYKIKEARSLRYSELSIWSEKRSLEPLAKEIEQISNSLQQMEKNRRKRFIFQRNLLDTRKKIISKKKILKLPDEKEITIEPGSFGDIDSILDLWEKLMDEHYQFDRRFRRRELGRIHMRYHLSSSLFSSDFILLVARSEGKVIGFMSAQIIRNPIFLPPSMGQIADAFILQEWRGKGIGSAMVNYIIEWFREKNVVQIDLNVAIANEKGRNFWKKQGFTPYLEVVSRWLDERKKSSDKEQS